MTRHEQSWPAQDPRYTGTIGGNKVRALREAAKFLIASRQAERAVLAGMQAPAFRLRDQDGIEVSSHPCYDTVQSY